MPSQKVFAIVVGSGFSGGLAAWILQRNNRDVVLIDRNKHPRFAIGESSTPTADFLLAHLADRWNLPEVAPLACWGTWKKTYPKVGCGKKRGFSYFRHQEGRPFCDDEQHSNSFLVAASCEDMWSDTQWLREDVDQFFFEGAKSEGTLTLEGSSIQSATWNPKEGLWRVEIETSDGEVRSFESTWLIDASGGGNAIAKWVGQRDDSDWMRTRTGSIFGHFTNVRSFSKDNYAFDALQQDPFFGDDAAQHHIFESGWYWMIRFDHGVTSVGVVQPESHWKSDSNERLDPDQTWKNILARYPGIAECMQDAKLVAPKSGLQFQRRLSRCRDRAGGAGWLAMPAAYGFIDPLHSTGIAHSLSGVARVVDILLGDPSEAESKQAVYTASLARELRWLDTLVSGCYRGLPSFERFIGFGTFYFLAAIAFEKQMAIDPSHWPVGFLQCNDAKLLNTAETFHSRLASLQSEAESKRWIADLREESMPWNQVGLLDPKLRNRLKHTVAPKYASIASREINSGHRDFR